jgi:ankyrin repeat protein
MKINHKVLLLLACVLFAGCATSQERLHSAIEKQDLLRVRKLLASGINLKKDDTALLTAVKVGSLDCVKLLVEAGADVNKRDGALMKVGSQGDYYYRVGDTGMWVWTANIGHSPLSLAVDKGRADIVQYLLEHGATIPDRVLISCGLSGLWTTPWRLAAGHGKEIEELLRQHSGQDKTIHDAAQVGDFEMVKKMLKANPDLVSSKDDKYGATPLHWAAAMGHKDVAELLLANKADVNARNNNGLTPLHWAAMNDHNNDMAELLLANHADINAKDNDGTTPLFAAMSKSKKDMVELLRQRGGQ